jgi:DDE superfamily endonuclease
MIQCFGTALYTLAEQYFNNPALYKHYMLHYAVLISDKTFGLMDNIWGFIDAIIRPTCQSVYLQEYMYTGYKCCHALKFQSIVTPDGMVACLHGPFVARRHDLRILRKSRVLDQLQQLMPEDGNEMYMHCMVT